MRVSSILLVVIVLILVISSLCIWFYPSAQDFMTSNTMWNGITSFSRKFSADIIESPDKLPILPQQTVLITIPYLEYSDEELSRIKQFVADGGTLLLMDDYGHGNSILAYLGVKVRFTNKPLLDPLFYYRNQSLPRITDFTPEVRDEGIDVITLNHATTLTSVPESEVIAWSSSSSFLDTNENGSREEGEPQGPFPVAAQLHLGQGSLTVVADPSIMINSMVGRDNNDNFMKYLTHYKGGLKKVLVDSAPLTTSPRDVSRVRLVEAREVLSSPYTLLGISALIFVLVCRYTLKKGETIDQS